MTMAVPASCIDDYLELAMAVPYLISSVGKPGTTDVKAKVLLRFAFEIAQVTQTFSVQSAHTLTSKDHLIQLSFSLNSKAIVDGLQKAFQAKIQKPFICPNLRQILSLRSSKCFLQSSQ